MNGITVESIMAQVHLLPPRDRLILLEKLATMIRMDFAPVEDWHTFLESTYGALSDDPIERMPQPKP